MKDKSIGEFEYFDESSINRYDSVIIYGAGTYGRRFLNNLNRWGIDKRKIEVWDINAKNIDEIAGFKVCLPYFESLNNVTKIAVVVAMNMDNYVQDIKEIITNFKNAGITENIFVLRPPSTTDISFSIEDFTNDAYFDCHYQEDMDFSSFELKVKTLAFYLPQFHEIPENNKWWGKGFTEWTNVKANRPRFTGHYQPREPHEDFGYYDLSDVNVIRKQAELAKRHGIYGWCMYYYWFSGVKLLTKPIDLLLENKDIDINFCLMWCNETWSKKWVGEESEILIRSDYLESGPQKFINDLRKYTDDKRYIRINGKPVIFILNPQKVPDLNNLIENWRTCARNIGMGELFIVAEATQSANNWIEHKSLFDACLNMKVYIWQDNFFRITDKNGKILSSRMAFYKKWKENIMRRIADDNYDNFPTCFTGFDNSARYYDNFGIFDIGFLLRDFYELVKYAAERSVKYNKEFIFIFAWNEWAESAYLEPDKKYGYAMINTLSKAIFNLPFEWEGKS